MEKLTGYIIRDRAGVCGIVTGINKKFDQVNLGYIKENTVLEQMTPKPNEDNMDFQLRVAENIQTWHLRLLSN